MDGPPMRQFSTAAYQPISSSPPQSPSTRSSISSSSHSRTHSRSHSHSYLSSYLFHRARSRTTIVALAAVPVTLCALALLAYHFLFRFDEYVYGVPDVPDYDEYAQWEDNLPQHNASSSLSPSAKRYLMFSNQAWGYGLNNQLQEVLLLSHVAWLAQRAYVFQPYVWDATNSSTNAVLDGHGGWRSARIPLNVFISGPTAGGPLPEGSDDARRAVNVKYWEKVCPEERRKVLDVGEEHVKWGVDEKTQGGELVDRWAALLRGLEEECVEVTGDTIFSFGLIASPRILSIWPSFSVSPILTRFAWSNLINAAVQRNLPLFHDPVQPPSEPHLPDDIRWRRAVEDDEQLSPRGDSAVVRATYQGGAARNRRPPSPVFTSLSLQTSSSPSSTNATTTPTIQGLIAVHLRRGDFKMHCHWLADHSEPFAGWNQFPYLLDRFTPPEGSLTGLNVVGRKKVHDEYVGRCWPDVSQVVRRLKEIRRLHPGLERVFVLTNGKKEWVEELKSALVGEEGEVESSGSGSGGVGGVPVPPSNSGNAKWKAVLTSKDLDLHWTEREIDQAVDMEIARRAEVFLGNGFSSLTSNIVMLRLSDSSPIQNIRFW